MTDNRERTDIQRRCTRNVGYRTSGLILSMAQSAATEAEAPAVEWLVVLIRTVELEAGEGITSERIGNCKPWLAVHTVC